MSQHKLVEALEADDAEAIRAALALPDFHFDDCLVEFTRAVFNLGVAVADKMTPEEIESSAKHTSLCAGFVLLQEQAEAESLDALWEKQCMQCEECGCMN